jgi:putative spermidine/putrescine transport system substrate-binding protein
VRKLSLNNPLTRRKFLEAASALGVTSFLAACGLGSLTGKSSSPSPSGSSALTGKLGGTLNYIGFEGEDDKKAGKPFLDKYKMTLNSTYIGDNPEILTKYKAAGPGRYDVCAQYDRFIPLMIDQGMVQPLDLDLIPNWSQVYSKFQDVPWIKRNGKIWGVPAYFGFLTAFNYRSDKVVPAPDTYDPPYAVLIDPKYKGKVGVRSDATDNLLLIGALVYGFGVDGTKYTKAQLNQCLDWAKKLKANTKTQLAGYGELADAFIRGDIWLGTVGWEYISLQCQRAGVPVTHNLQHTGPTPAWTDTYMIFNGAPNATAAHAWINHMISAEAMAISTQNLGSFVSNKNVTSLVPAEFAKAMGYASLSDQLDRAIWGVLPAAHQTDTNLATLDDFNSGWEAIWGGA